MHHPTITLVCLAGTVLAASLSAQQLVLPTHADLAEGHHAVSLPFGSPGFRSQLLIDAAAIAPNGAVLQALRLRADRSSLPLSATAVPNVVVSLSHSSRMLGNLGTTFAGNVTAAPTVVFQGTVALPGHTEGFAGPLPWDVVVTFTQPFVFDVTQGNLLIDLVGNNPAGVAPSFWLDAMEAGGASTTFGVSGDIPGGDTLDLLVATGNSLDPHRLTIGNTIDYVSTMSFASPPGVLALGTTSPSIPIDLGPIGAPSNFLYVDAILLAPHAWNQGFIGFHATFSLTLPSLPALIGERIYGQSAVLEPSANPLGLVLSAAVETRIGDPIEVLPVQQVDADDPQAVSGTLVDFGFGSPSYGAAALQLEGVMF